MKKDLTFDCDMRGDYAFFIDAKHFLDNGWEVDNTVKDALSRNSNPVFFRVIENGKEQSGHGWIENGEIIQWG